MIKSRGGRRGDKWWGNKRERVEYRGGGGGIGSRQISL
jgi:hypothetical protein